MKSVPVLFLIAAVSFATCMSCGKNNDDDIKPLEDTVKISFMNQRVVITNPYEQKGVKITANGADVVVTSTLSDEVTYILSGSTSEGSLKIYSDTRFELKMNGVTIANSDDPALNIQSGKKATVTLVEGTVNNFVGGEKFVSEGGSEDVKAAFFSEGQLVFHGTGILTVGSLYRHAICSDDYIQIDGGNIGILSSSDGIHAKDYIEVNDGTIEITSGSDGMDSEGYIHLYGGDIKITTRGTKGHGIKSATETVVRTAGDIDINVQGNASKAFNCGGNMRISEGNIHLETSGDAFYDTAESDISSAAGIKCDGNLTLDGGNVVIVSSGSGGKGINVNGTLTLNNGVVAVTATGENFNYSDSDTEAKAIKSDGDLTVNGGLIYAYSTSHHGIDSKRSLTIAGGTVVAVGSDSSKKGFDYGNTFKITGGTILGIGGTAILPTASVCTQYAIACSGNMIQDTLFNITSSTEKNILTCRIPYTLSRAAILFSSSDLEMNASYTISSGGSVSGGNSFHGLYSGATYSGGTVQSSFTVSSMVTNVW